MIEAIGGKRGVTTCILAATVAGFSGYVTGAKSRLSGDDFTTNLIATAARTNGKIDFGDAIQFCLWSPGAGDSLDLDVKTQFRGAAINDHDGDFDKSNNGYVALYQPLLNVVDIFRLNTTRLDVKHVEQPDYVRHEPCPKTISITRHGKMPALKMDPASPGVAP